LRPPGALGPPLETPCLVVVAARGHQGATRSTPESRGRGAGGGGAGGGAAPPPIRPSGDATQSGEKEQRRVGQEEQEQEQDQRYFTPRRFVRKHREGAGEEQEQECQMRTKGLRLLL